MKKKKLVKKALQKPELYSSAEMQYMQLWLQETKRKKQEKKKAIAL